MRRSPAMSAVRSPERKARRVGQLPIPLSMAASWRAAAAPGLRTGREVVWVTGVSGTTDEPVNYRPDDVPCVAACADADDPEVRVPGADQEQTPVTDRGRRTRAALVQAGRELFEERGFG